MPASATARILPERRNPLLNSPPPHEQLVEQRRLGQTKLQEKGLGVEPFSYVHLRVSLPNPLEDQELFGRQPPESYFLMRRSKDGFVSSTGMFKASFPWARKSEESFEKQYIKLNYPKTSNEETAGNLWVEPSDALKIAEEYGIKPWIEALLDNQPVDVSVDSKKRNITPPPVFLRNGTEPDRDTPESILEPTPPPPRRRVTRSASPAKQRPTATPRKARASRAGISKATPLKKAIKPVEEVAEVEEKTTTETTAVSTEQTTLIATPVENGDEAGHSPAKAKKSKNVKVEVDEEVEKTADGEVERTHIKVEMPQAVTGEPPSAEDTKKMIEEARKMVAEARQEADDEANAGKRKAEEDAEDETEEQREAKRARNAAIQSALRREKVKNRTLIGLTATLALGALLPYIL